MKKVKMIAPVATTEMALYACLQDNTPLFCIENPLYSRMSLFSNELTDYDVENHSQKQVAVLKKVRGENPFNEDKYSVSYLPLTWEDWHS